MSQAADIPSINAPIANDILEIDLPLTAREAASVVRFLFGSRATIEPRVVRYVIKVDGKLLAEGKDIVLSICNAIQEHCARTGESTDAFLQRAHAARRQKQDFP